jgi:hypothetical protein
MRNISICIPTFGSTQKRHCARHQTPRYYRLEWVHLTASLEDAKRALTTLPYKFYGIWTPVPVLSLENAEIYPYELYWDEGQKEYLDCTLDVLVDIGTIRDCKSSLCGRRLCWVSVAGRNPHIKIFRTSGMTLCNTYGESSEDRETVFSRVYTEQTGLMFDRSEDFGSPIVKFVQLL